MYFLLVTCLMFALLLLLNMAASLTASAVWQIIRKFAQDLPAQNRARLIFSLRTLPLIFALLLVFAFLLPSYFLFEPDVSNETVSIKLAIITLISAVGVFLALSRVFATWWRTRRLIREWTRSGEPMVISNVFVPVFRFRHPFPVIAVVGILRPRIFIAEQIFSLLKDEEFAAAIVHEFGHLAARDNFKRTFLRVCRDLLILPIGKTLDRLWIETAEAAADEYALSTGGSQTALNLAAALVKIARAIPENTKPAMPAGAFLVGEQVADIDWRVRQLVRLTECENDFARRKLNFSIYLWCGFALLSLPILVLATNYDFLSKVHQITESVVAILQ